MRDIEANRRRCTGEKIERNTRDASGHMIDTDVAQTTHPTIQTTKQKNESTTLGKT